MMKKKINETITNVGVCKTRCVGQVFYSGEKEARLCTQDLKRKTNVSTVLCRRNDLTDVLSLPEMLSKQDGLSFMGARQSGRRQETRSIHLENVRFESESVAQASGYGPKRHTGPRWGSCQAGALTVPRGVSCMRQDGSSQSDSCQVLGCESANEEEKPWILVRALPLNEVLICMTLLKSLYISEHSFLLL